MFLVPLFDQTLIGCKERLLGRLLYALTIDDSGDTHLPHGKRLHDLPDRQAFHGAEMLHSAFKRFILITGMIGRHGGIIIGP